VRRPLPAGPVAVIDILRATSTIVTALAAGAPWVEPVASVATARRRRRADPRSLLAGERHGDRLPGFDLGNSPVEAAGLGPSRGVVLTTTNGTRACDRLVRQGAGGDDRPVYAAAFTNLAAVAAALRRDVDRTGAEVVTIVCSGQDGHSAAEDLLAAGALVTRLPAAWERDDLATVAEWAWRDGEGARLVERLTAAPHGATLAAKGYGDDIAACARIDVSDAVPRLRVEAGRARFVLAGTTQR
jgi:2-phosphosulfolactate phosphatase